MEDAIPDSVLEQTIELDSMLGIDNVATYDISSAWSPRSSRDFLKESAQGGMGPHGLCVGATGSGKSEVLRTLVLSQVICHPPEDLSLVLVDYKGGATFAGRTKTLFMASIVSYVRPGALWPIAER